MIERNTSLLTQAILENLMREMICRKKLILLYLQ